MNELAIIKERLSTFEGIEIGNSQEIVIVHNRLFVYRGFHVLVYIRDQYVTKHSSSPFEYKYHICNCKTIADMMAARRLARYVVSTRSDGMFFINTYDLETGDRIESGKIEQLSVCKNCLMELRYEGYSDHFRDRHIYESFQIGKFFSKYGGEFSNAPQFNDQNAPPNEYSKNFEQISYSFRDINNWQCSVCRIDLRSDKDLLDTHHLNGIKSDNSWDNLQCLCVRCHSDQPFHDRLKKDERYVQFVRKYCENQ